MPGMADDLERLRRRWSSTRTRQDLRRYVEALAASGEVCRRVAKAIDEELGPEDERKAREFLRLAAYASAWVLSADADDGAPKRPWAWECSEVHGFDRGCVLAVRDPRGGVVLGFGLPDEKSEDILAWRRHWRDSDVPALRERAAQGRPVQIHPGHCWPELSGLSDGFWGVGAWSGAPRAYDWRLESQPQIARWCGEGATGQVRLDEAQARALVVEVYGFDRSDNDETLAALESGAWRRRTGLLDDRRDGELGLLFGVKPPPLHGLQPENAAGSGWAEWAALRLADVLSGREAWGKRLTTSLEDRHDIHGRARSPRELLARRKGKLESREYDVARESVLVWPAGSVRMRETGRRSIADRVAEKAIMVTVAFPRNMREGRQGEHAVDKEGLFLLTTGRGPYGESYGAKDRDHAPYGLMGMAEVARKAIKELFPGAKVAEQWRW